MAPQTLTINFDTSSDALFRAWATALSNAISAAGFVQTADTGQINLTTVTRAGVNLPGGYQVWRFADSLQSSAPVFFKIEYGQNASASQPQIWLTVGTGSNGSGTITGTDIANVTGAVTSRVATLASAFATTSCTVYVNGDGAALMIASVSGASGGFVNLIERTRAWDGSSVGDGFVLLSSSFSSGAGNCVCMPINYLPGLGALQPTSTNNAAALNGQTSGSASATTLMFGTTVYAVPFLTGVGVKFGAPSQYVMAVMPGDYPSDRSVTMTHYGTSRTWRTGGVGNASGGANWGSWPFGCKSCIVRID